MKKWIRIFLVCFVLVGGTAVFAHQLLNQFNKALDNLTAASLAFAKIPPIPISEKTSKEQILTTTSTSTPETITASATSTDLKFSLIFPKKNSEVYIGCTYQLLFQSTTTTSLVETVLIDAGTIETVEPITSGLAMEHEVEPDSQGLDWKVGAVLPGEYYIKVSNINGVDSENYSDIFTIGKMQSGIGVKEREKICKETEGSL